MNLLKHFLYTIIGSCALLAIAGGCKKEYRNAASPYNEITSFRIAYNGTDSLKAAIAHDSIIVYWSGFEAVPDSVTPTILISENARIYPASGQKVALTTGTEYTVTAQDSSRATYHLVLKVYQDQPVIGNSRQHFNINTNWLLSGLDNLIPDTALTRLYVIDKAGREVNIPLQAVNVKFISTEVIPAGLVDTGYYRIKLVNNMYTVYSADSAIQVYATPVVTSISPVKGVAGDVVTITGAYFSATAVNNTVTINGTTTEVLAATSTSLQIKVPDGATTGPVAVTVGGHTGTAPQAFTVLAAAATTVTTFAGNGTVAIVDGPAASASFRTITGLTFDAAGNLYVVENSNNIIRKVSAAGDVAFFAGSGSATFAEGTGAAASFYNPVGITTGPDGNLYLADYWNQRIRKVTPGAATSTAAGSGTRGLAEGPAATAMFSLPRDVVFDAGGNLYVAELTNARIRKITPAGNVTTFAGTTAGYTDGPAATAQFRAPYGMAIDANGNLYVADATNHCIRKITPAGDVSTLAGNGTAGFADGIGTAARFNQPNGIAIDANGYIYVADYGNHRIRRVSPDGRVITYAGSGENGFADGTGSEAKFSYPRAIAIDAAGNLFVTSGNRIRKITPP
jgi:sugar lactone lactonase YvrE